MASSITQIAAVTPTLADTALMDSDEEVTELIEKLIRLLVAPSEPTRKVKPPLTLASSSEFAPNLVALAIRSISLTASWTSVAAAALEAVSWAAALAAWTDR